MSRAKKTGKDAPWTPEKVRQRIQVSVVLNRLINHALGKNKMTQTQVRAAEILLRKALPDLRTVEHSGHVKKTVEHVAVSETDRRIEGLFAGGKDRDTKTALPH